MINPLQYLGEATHGETLLFENTVTISPKVYPVLNSTAYSLDLRTQLFTLDFQQLNGWGRPFANTKSRLYFSTKDIKYYDLNSNSVHSANLNLKTGFSVLYRQGEIQVFDYFNKKHYVLNKDLKQLKSRKLELPEYLLKEEREFAAEVISKDHILLFSFSNGNSTPVLLNTQILTCTPLPPKLNDAFNVDSALGVVDGKIFLYNNLNHTHQLHIQDNDTYTKYKLDIKANVDLLCRCLFTRDYILIFDMYQTNLFCLHTKEVKQLHNNPKTKEFALFNLRNDFPNNRALLVRSSKKDTAHFYLIDYNTTTPSKPVFEL